MKPQLYAIKAKKVETKTPHTPELLDSGFFSETFLAMLAASLQGLQNYFTVLILHEISQLLHESA